MTNPPIHITPHHLTLTPTVNAFIRAKISALSRIAGDVLAADVVVRGTTGAAHRFSVSARLALPGQDIQGNATNADLYTAIRQLAARLARLSRKRKTRFEKTMKRPAKTRMHPAVA
ncbi:MAG TPA: ribosome-associated translation inhibitor RaiA [Candidatus Acidoferrum sp.]|nr:ribosome-associated translation inhibitor RaiA [Candidatus Acidoferrum sp.]